MRQLFCTAAFVCTMTVIAAAQPGAEITMPPNASKAARFAFVNSCLTGQTFKVGAEPEAAWLKFSPATVDVGPDTSFGVSLTVNSLSSGAGAYRSHLNVFCTSCASSNPPCFQQAQEFDVHLTVVNGARIGEFQAIAEAPAAPAPAATKLPPAPFTPPPPPRPSYRALLPFIAFGLLGVGMVGIVLAFRGLFSRRSAPGPQEVFPEAESERHHVRR